MAAHPPGTLATACPSQVNVTQTPSYTPDTSSLSLTPASYNISIDGLQLELPNIEAHHGLLILFVEVSFQQARSQ